MKHLLNNTNQGEVTPWVTLDEDGVHYSGNVVIEEDPYEYVDLGLPSGTLWATCNIGANSPEEYGKYFQWGDTVGYEGNEAKAHSTWSTAPFNNGSSKYDGAYFTSVKDIVCPNDVLANEYDAAYANTNGKQKMPTQAQLDELTANTTSEWTTVNGVNGRKFTSKIDPTKSIFVPASGYFDYTSQTSVSFGGYIWSSNLYTSNPNYVYRLRCGSSDASWNPDYRYYGFAVRGVKNPS